MAEPTREPPADDTVDDDARVDDPRDGGRSDEDRGISDVGLPRPGDGADPGPDEAATEAALDDAFPPADAGRA